MGRATRVEGRAHRRPGSTRLAVSLIAVLLAAAAAAPRRAVAEDPGVEDLCALVEGVVSPAMGTITETIVGMFHDEIGQQDLPGCLVIVSGSWKELGKEPAPLDRVVDALTAKGWKQNPDYAADGPDGTVIGLEKGKGICIVRGSWDGGDDSDSTYVPSDVYQVTILCAEIDEAAAR
jgi:hypothetical protein